MREIDEVAEASTEGDEGNSSLIVTILRAGTLSPALGPRSPPASFEDFIEETVTTTLTEAAGRYAASPVEPDPLPQLVVGPSAQLKAPSIKQKGKRVAPNADEGPEHKRLHANRDSRFMVGRILAMAKVFTPPSSQNPPTAISSLGLVAPLHSPGVPVARSEAGPTIAVDSVREEEVPLRKSPTSPSLGEDQDNFSLEFNRLQEEVASKREVFEKGSSVPILSTGPKSPTPITTLVVPETSTSSRPTSLLKPDRGRISRPRG
jgi:hypothetical protein